MIFVSVFKNHNKTRNIIVVMKTTTAVWVAQSIQRWTGNPRVRDSSPNQLRQTCTLLTNARYCAKSGFSNVVLNRGLALGSSQSLAKTMDYSYLKVVLAQEKPSQLG